MLSLTAEKNINLILVCLKGGCSLVRSSPVTGLDECRHVVQLYTISSAGEPAEQNHFGPKGKVNELFWAMLPVGMKAAPEEHIPMALGWTRNPPALPPLLLPSPNNLGTQWSASWARVWLSSCLRARSLFLIHMRCDGVSGCPPCVPLWSTCLQVAAAGIEKPRRHPLSPAWHRSGTLQSRSLPIGQRWSHSPKDTK